MTCHAVGAVAQSVMLEFRHIKSRYEKTEEIPRNRGSRGTLAAQATGGDRTGIGD
jgi:hypothetical protein